MRANILSVVFRSVHDTVGEIGPISPPPAYPARARATKRERRVVALLFPFIQATARRQLSATTVATCCKCVKTHLQHLGIAAAMNMVRVVTWLDGDELAPTRVSAFQRLYAAA